MLLILKDPYLSDRNTQDQIDLVLVPACYPANPNIIRPIRKHLPVLDQVRGFTSLLPSNNWAWFACCIPCCQRYMRNVWKYNHPIHNQNCMQDDCNSVKSALILQQHIRILGFLAFLGEICHYVYSTNR